MSRILPLGQDYGRRSSAGGPSYRLDVARLDTQGLSPDEGREAYLDAISHLLATDFLDHSVRARMASAYFGPLHLITSTISARRSERTAAHVGDDGYDGIGAQLCLAGRSIGNAAGRRLVSEPGSLMLIDFAQPFVLTDQSERTTVHLSIPRKLVQQRHGDPATLHGRMLDSTAADLLGAQMQAGARRMADLTEGTAAVLAGAMLDTFVAVLDGGPAGSARPPARRDRLAGRARRLVDALLGSPDLTPDRLMARLDISRSDLYALFEDAGGVSRYIWRRRLEMARQALTDPGDRRKIGEIAFALGFSSEAHFSRAFRQAYDMTPSAMRRHGTAAEPADLTAR